MDYTQFIKPELLVLVPALYGLGLVLKNTHKISNNYIPAMLTAVSVALSLLYILSTDGINGVSVFTAIVQGLICVAVAVYGNEVIKQIKRGE